MMKIMRIIAVAIILLTIRINYSLPGIKPNPHIPDVA